MPVTSVKPLVLTYLLPQGEAGNSGAAYTYSPFGAGRKQPVVPDSLNLSSKGVELSRSDHGSTVPLPEFGRLQLGAPEPLPFGPDQDANALNRIPGDGVQTQAKGVEFGHRPARGLNILA